MIFFVVVLKSFQSKLHYVFLMVKCNKTLSTMHSLNLYLIYDLILIYTLCKYVERFVDEVIKIKQTFKNRFMHSSRPDWTSVITLSKKRNHISPILLPLLPNPSENCLQTSASRTFKALNCQATISIPDLASENHPNRTF